MTRTVRFAALILPLTVLAGPLFAQGAPAATPAAPATETPAASDAAPAGATTVSHGIGVFGPPELPADFPHLRYVNADAPKGAKFRWRCRAVSTAITLSR